jgi:hypothetical protein
MTDIVQNELRKLAAGVLADLCGRYICGTRFSDKHYPAIQILEDSFNDMKASFSVEILFYSTEAELAYVVKMHDATQVMRERFEYADPAFPENLYKEIGERING